MLWRPTRPFRTNTKKRCPFHHRGLECKSRKSKDTWSNGQVWLWSTKWSRAKANRVLTRECTGHSKHFLPKHKKWLYTWTPPEHSYHLHQIPYDYTVEVTNRFKGLDLIDRVPEELRMKFHDIVQEAVIKTIPKKKEVQNGKMVVWGGLTNSGEKKRS